MAVRDLLPTFRSRTRVAAVGRGTLFYVALDRDYPLGEDGLLGKQVTVDGYTFDVQRIEAIDVVRDRYHAGELVGLLAPFFV